MVRVDDCIRVEYVLRIFYRQISFRCSIKIKAGAGTGNKINLLRISRINEVFEGENEETGRNGKAGAHECCIEKKLSVKHAYRDRPNRQFMAARWRAVKNDISRQGLSESTIYACAMRAVKNDISRQPYHTKLASIPGKQ